MDGEQNASTSDAAGTNDDANSGGKQEESFKPITSEAELITYKETLRKNIAADVRRTIEADLKAKADAEKEDARKTREADDAKAKGDFEKVEAQLRSDLETTKTEATRLQGENDQLREAVNGSLETRVKELPEPVRKTLDDTFPADEVLARLNWLNKTSVQELIKAHVEKADPARGNGRDPKGGGAAKADDEAARLANTRRYA